MQAEIPRLKAAAAKNDSARRDTLARLHEHQCNNQTDILNLARRAQVPLQTVEAQWDVARNEADAAIDRSSVAVASAPPALAAQPIPPAQWGELPPPAREDLSLEGVNAFWLCLRGHFDRREVRVLQLTQLAALGIGINEDDKHARQLRLLQRLGRLRIGSNSVELT